MKKHVLYLSLITVVLSASGTGPVVAQTSNANAIAQRQFAPAYWKETRMKPYCEIFVARPTNSSTEIEVDIYNSATYNDCPVDKVAALDLQALKKQTSSAKVIFNPRRMWMADSFTIFKAAEKATFGGIDMQWVAVARLPAQMDERAKGKPYQIINVARDTEKRYVKGRPVVELISPDGMNWIMQSTVDKPVSLGTFADVIGKLDLPAGWGFRIRTLSRDLIMRTNGMADIVQDTMLNVYEACKGDVCRED